LPAILTLRSGRSCSSGSASARRASRRIESYRDYESDTPRQRIIVNLGPHATPAEALKAARAEAGTLKAAGAPEGAIAAAQDRIKTLERLARKLRA
jgi:hypothetical protein